MQTLIKEGSPHFQVQAQIEKEEVEQTLTLFFDGKIKRVEHNATRYPYFAPLIGLFPHVLYAPEDMGIVSGSPALRRKLLDLHISQIDPLYLHHLARYHKAMRHRNELLKNRAERAIEPWEQMMSDSGTYVIQKRSQLIKQLQDPLRETLFELSGGADRLDIAYRPSISISEANNLRTHWERHRKKEIQFGTTLQGPHRDEIDFFVDSLPAKAFASQGQKHSILAALRLCQWRHLQEDGRSLPIFSVDDFGVHLDKLRQTHFEKKVENLGQIFLTSPKVGRQIFSHHHLIHIEGHSLTRCT